MWWKNDGYFLAELLLSLSAWLVATCFLLPLTVLLIDQSIQFKQEADATYLLYDQLQQLKFHSNLSVNKKIEKAGTEYSITTNERGSGKMEVCIEFEGYTKKKSTKCGMAE